mmetsp:Transcript_30550/g.63751  ORF Transcript_30550/g.63751 Transcript_30550/m.63751 type:complete len:80 (-) Transcript_30550:53-292(-)
MQEHGFIKAQRLIPPGGLGANDNDGWSLGADEELGIKEVDGWALGTAVAVSHTPVSSLHAQSAATIQMPAALIVKSNAF